MAEVIRNIFKVYVDSDWKVTNTIPAPIAAFGNGQTTIRIVSAEANPAEYTGGLNFILASGETLDERQYMTSNSIEVVDGEDWYVWDFPLTRFITSNSSKNASGTLYFTSVFKSISDPNNEYPQVPQSGATISASSQTVTEILEDDVVQQISGDLNNRLLKDSTGLTDVDNDNVNLIPFYDSTSQLQTKQTKVDFIQDVIDEIGDTTGVIAYPTDGLAGITSPLTGNPVTRTVDDINDEDFDQDNPVIVPYIILATGVWEIAFESVYPIGFLTGEYQSLVFTQNLFAKKTGDNIEARTSYYIYDAINGLRIIGSGPGTFEGAVITASTDDYSAHSKQNVINALSVDPGIGERVYTVTEVRGTAGDTATAQLEDSVSTFSTWQLPTGGALAGLIRKIPSPVEDNLVSQNADGSLKDGAIAIGDVMQKSVELPLLQLRSEKNQPNGYAGIEADGFISNAILPQSLKRWLGTFGTAGSDTGGDLPTVAVSVGDTYECIIDAYNSVVAGEIFDNGDFATYNGTGWSKTDNTEAVKSVNGKTGIITIISTDIPDMPSSLAGQGRKIFKVSEDELTYELARENNNSSTGIEIADDSIPSLNVDVTKYNLTAGTIKFIDLSFDPAKTHIIPVSAETGLSITGIATRKRTYLAYQLLDATLKTYQIVSLSGAPTTLEYRNLVPFAIAFHPDGVNISRIDPLGWVSVQHSKNAMDMSGSYLSSNKQGNDFIPNGVNLNLDVSLGKMACLGCNRVVAPSDPNNVDNPASTNEGFILVYRDGLGDLTFDTNGGSLFTTIDPTWFDDGTGVIGTNPGNANSAVMNRIYRSPRSNTSYILVGQTSYATIGDAISARVAGTDNVQNIPTYLDEDLVFRTYFSVRKNATNLSLITDAELFNVLGESGVTAGGVVTTLNDTAVTVTGSVGDLPAQVNVKEAQEMFEYKHIAFSQILQFVIEDEITTAKAKVNNNVILKPFQKYDIQLPTFVSANPIELSLDDGTTHAPLVDEFLVAINGTDRANDKMTIFWNGASIVNYVNQDLADLKARMTIVETKRAIMGGGAIINGGFAINQRAVSGTVILASGEYGHDRWRGGAAGCTYTFATSLNVTTITIVAGSLAQEIEGINLESGMHTLSWVGTSQAQIDGNGFTTSPTSETLTGGANATMEFGTGTVTKVKLEQDIIATDFILKPNAVELRDCQRYTKVFEIDAVIKYLGDAIGISGTFAQGTIKFITRMRTQPTLIVTPSELSLSDGTTVIPCTGISLITVGDNEKGYFNINTASGLIQYRPYFLQTNTFQSVIILDAEL